MKAETDLTEKDLTGNMFIYTEYPYLIIKYERIAMRLFTFNSYKDFLRAQVAANANVRGYQARMAEAAGCQPSYYSQMLSSKVDLTLDHAAGIADFLQLHGVEQDYFFALVNHARASTKRLQSVFKQKLDAMKAAHLEVSKRIADPKQNTEGIERLYYSSWTWTAIHMAICCSDLQDVAAISKHLDLSGEIVRSTLEQLQTWGFADRKKDKWSFKGGASHLTPNSPMNQMNHLNWRAQATRAIQRGNDGNLHYSSVFTVTKDDFENLKELMIQAIVKSRKIISPSESEVICSMSCDLFRI